jgi:hypothetical protein
MTIPQQNLLNDDADVKVMETPEARAYPGFVANLGHH